MTGSEARRRAEAAASLLRKALHRHLDRDVFVSMVLRSDRVTLYFSGSEPMTQDDLRAVETLVREAVRANTPTEAGILSGSIGMFTIIGEREVEPGIRQIEALTGEAADNHVAEIEAILNELADRLRCERHQVPARLAALATETFLLDRWVHQGVEPSDLDLIHLPKRSRKRIERMRREAHNR